MIVQWCVKGLDLPDDQAARGVIDQRQGILCNWWRSVNIISPNAIREKLTPDNLDRHINHFDSPDPATGRPFSINTPFISLSAGVVERNQAARTNYVHRARHTALWFGSRFGQQQVAYLYPCWLVVGPRASVEIEGVGEEVRDLNSYRKYSAFQTEGEITAKVAIPDNQIQACERWEIARVRRQRQLWAMSWRYENVRFTEPDRLSNVRELI